MDADLDDDGTTFHETYDEAIAVAIAESEPGHVIVIHDESCDSDDDTMSCPCEPIEHVVGGKSVSHCKSPASCSVCLGFPAPRRVTLIAGQVAVDGVLVRQGELEQPAPLTKAQRRGGRLSRGVERKRR